MEIAVQEMADTLIDTGYIKDQRKTKPAPAEAAPAEAPKEEVKAEEEKVEEPKVEEEKE